MHQYALHYYRKASALRPYDARMWCAVAGCYESVSKVRVSCNKPPLIGVPLKPVTSHLAALNLFMVNKPQLNRGTASVPLLCPSYEKVFTPLGWVDTFS